MSFFIRVPPRRWAGGAITLLAALAFLGGGTVSLAEPANQATTPTPTATSAQAAVSSCVSSTQGIQVVLGNPSPGDSLVPGTNVVMSGVAYDPAATPAQGTGIDRVSAYLGDRDAGGTFLGNAALGLPSPLAGAGSQFATAGFTLRSLTLPTVTGSRGIFVYAHSFLSNKEGVLSVPVFLGAVPTPVKGQVPTAVLPPPPACTPTPLPTVTAVPTVPSASTPLPAAPTPTLAVLPVVPTTAATPLTPVPSVSAPAPAAPAVRATAIPLTSTAPSAAPAAATTATTAPRGGGIPAELGFGLVALGGLVLGGGVTLRRRERAAPRREGDPPAVV